MTKLLTLLILLTACGSVEDGAVSVSVNPTPAPSTESDENIFQKNDQKDWKKPEDETEETSSDEVVSDDVVAVSPSPSPSATPSTLDLELISQKKEVFDNLIQTRIDNLFTWDLGQDWAAKEDRDNYRFIESKDYQGFYGNEAYNLSFAKDHGSSVGHYPKSICGEGGFSSVSFSESYVRYQDDTTAKIRIEIAFDETNFEGIGDPLPIKYIRLWLKKSDAEELSWTNSYCN